MALRLSKENMRAALAALRSYLATGMTDQDICQTMGISWVDYEDLKNKLLESEAAKISSRSSEDVFVEYMLNQEINVRDLTEMIQGFKSSKQHAAMVGAVKARAEIYDKIIKTGQELGFIDKVPEKTEIVAGVVVKSLSEEELREQLLAGSANFQGKVLKYGIGSNIVDIEPGPTHFKGPLELVAGQEVGEGDAVE